MAYHLVASCARWHNFCFRSIFDRFFFTRAENNVDDFLHSRHRVDVVNDDFLHSRHRVDVINNGGSLEQRWRCVPWRRGIFRRNEVCNKRSVLGASTRATGRIRGKSFCCGSTVLHCTHLVAHGTPRNKIQKEDRRKVEGQSEDQRQVEGFPRETRQGLQRSGDAQSKRQSTVSDSLPLFERFQNTAYFVNEEGLPFRTTKKQRNLPVNQQTEKQRILPVESLLSYAHDWMQARRANNLEATWDEFVRHCVSKTTFNAAFLAYFREEFQEPEQNQRAVAAEKRSVTTDPATPPSQNKKMRPVYDFGDGSTNTVSTMDAKATDATVVLGNNNHMETSMTNSHNRTNITNQYYIQGDSSLNEEEIRSLRVENGLLRVENGLLRGQNDAFRRALQEHNIPIPSTPLTGPVLGALSPNLNAWTPSPAPFFASAVFSAGSLPVSAASKKSSCSDSSALTKK